MIFLVWIVHFKFLIFSQLYKNYLWFYHFKKFGCPENAFLFLPWCWKFRSWTRSSFLFSSWLHELQSVKCSDRTSSFFFCTEEMPLHYTIQFNVFQFQVLSALSCEIASSKIYFVKIVFCPFCYFMFGASVDWEAYGGFIKDEYCSWVQYKSGPGGRPSM
jgi:hypothetical protein